MLVESSNSPGPSDWIVLGSCAVLAVLGFFWTGTGPVPGDRLTLAVTVVPADKSAVACASERSFEGLQCSHSTAQQNAPTRSIDKQQRLAPFVTVDRHLVILSGLFAYPSVTEQLAHARKQPSKERRILVECDVRLIEKTRGLWVRFERGGVFHSGEPAWVARTLDCNARPFHETSPP